ncbi:MAG: hypothetical protein D6785_00930, partial [Planctomycetota bacterium]
FLGGIVFIIGLWWYSTAYVYKGAPFFYEIFINQTLGRFLPKPVLKLFMNLFPEDAKAFLRINPDHERGFFYYIIKYPGLFAPWVVLLIPFFWLAPKEENSRLPLIWWAVIFLLFSVSKNKRTYYLLPLCPAAALLAARGYFLALEKGKEMFLKGFGYTLGSLYLVVGIAAPIALLALAPYRKSLARAFNFIDPLSLSWILCLGAAFCLAGIFLILLIRRERWPLVSCFMIFSFMVLWMGVWKSLLFGLEKEKNYSPHCKSWQKRLPPSRRIVFFHLFRDSIELNFRRFRPEGKWEYLDNERIWKLALKNMEIFWVPEEMGMTYQEMIQKIPRPFLLIVSQRNYKNKLEKNPFFHGEWLLNNLIDNRLWMVF